MNDDEMWDIIYIIMLVKQSSAEAAADATDEAMAVRAGGRSS
jgi:hypothetical protein